VIVTATVIGATTATGSATTSDSVRTIARLEATNRVMAAAGTANGHRSPMPRPAHRKSRARGLSRQAWRETHNVVAAAAGDVAGVADATIGRSHRARSMRSMRTRAMATPARARRLRRER